MQRRRFLGLAAFAATTVVGVGIAGSAQAAEPAAAAGVTYDPDTGWPIFDSATPPAGYTRSRLPCAQRQYVDVPDAAVAAASHEPLEVVHRPYPGITVEGTR